MKAPQSKAVVLLSGGMDSAVALSMVFDRHQARNVYPVSFSYGQKHVRERESALELVEHYNTQSLLEVDLPEGLFQGAGSALTDPDVEIPDGTYDDLNQTEGPSATYVPYRNGTFISMAAAYAMTVGASTVWIGAHADDAAGDAYPDCTPEFLGSQAAAIYIGSYREVRLVSPFQWMPKSGIVHMGRELHTPFELTWSCYRGGNMPCGTCATCVDRLNAFAACGMVDPHVYMIPYQERPDVQAFMSR